jgi:hypothetical protein
MTTQNVQVFIRSSEVGATNPLVIACYPESRPVPSDTHGEGMSVYIVPVEAIQQPQAGDQSLRMPMLVDNWQSMVSVTAVAAMRIGASFTVAEQIVSLHQMLDYIQSYGADPSKWPLEPRQHKAELDAKWKYVDAVNAAAEAHAAARPHDLSSDKVWPTRPSKK